MFRLTPLLLILWLSPLATFASEPINTLQKRLLGWKPSEIAILGYDPVAYHTEGAAIPGSADFAADWNGATWHFASAKHRDMFIAQPDRYAPQYGGYCAYGVAQGYLVKIDPEQWQIVHDKLYLNYDAGVQATWLADQATFIERADRDFARLLEQSD